MVKNNKMIWIIGLIIVLALVGMKKEATNLYQAECANYDICIPVGQDSWIDGSDYGHSKTHGTSTSLDVYDWYWSDEHDPAEAFIKFTTQAYPNIESVELNIYAWNLDGTVDVSLHKTQTGWTENSITWDNSPSVISQIGSKTINSDDKYYKFDITDEYKETTGDISFKLKSETQAGGLNDPDKGVYFSSKEYSTDTWYQSFIGINLGQTCTPVNGGWSEWSACAGGTQSRTCTNPAPSCGGLDCVGSSSQSCPMPEIECSSNSDCGTDGPVGDRKCSGNFVTQDVKNYTCYNAGTETSYCDSELFEDEIMIAECPNGCSNAVCLNCVDTTWDPLVSEKCSGESFTQLSNCGREQPATGTKDCPDECVPNNACAATTCKDKTCVNNCGKTIQGTKSCITTNATTCEVYQNLNDDGKCVVSSWVWIFGGLIGFLIMVKLISA